MSRVHVFVFKQNVHLHNSGMGLHRSDWLEFHTLTYLPH